MAKTLSMFADQLIGALIWRSTPAPKLRVGIDQMGALLMIRSFVMLMAIAAVPDRFRVSLMIRSFPATRSSWFADQLKGALIRRSAPASKVSVG